MQSVVFISFLPTEIVLLWVSWTNTILEMLRKCIAVPSSKVREAELVSLDNSAALGAHEEVTQKKLLKVTKQLSGF